MSTRIDMPQRLDKDSMRQALRALSRSDAAMRTVIQRYPACDLYRGRRSLFDTLAGAIIGQQLSVKAAATINKRVIRLTGTPYLTADGIAGCSNHELRAAGLSAAKTRYVQTLADAVQRGEINFRSLARANDENVIDNLTALPGIGVWTAQMFLMFGLHRPDVAAAGDLGLQRGMQMLHGLEERPDPQAFLELAECWAPWRSVACWYLWRIAG
ncbi:MAG: DNA-3-methyladenine glycosylase [Pseudomonadota bacterium]